MVKLPNAVVFDCDGTIADTESISGRAWRDTIAEHGYEMTDDDHRRIVGRTWAHNWPYFASRIDLGDPQAFRMRLRRRFAASFEQGLDVYPDALATIRALADADVPIAVASSSGRAHVERVLDAAGVRELVRAIVGVEDVERPKPDPDPYLRAAEALDVDPADASAVEDTPVGVDSALAAGMFTVGVVRILWPPEALGAAHRVVDEITVEALTPPAGTSGPTTGEGWA